MAIQLKVPSVGESITQVEIGDWLKKEGDTVQRDETVVVIETEKTTVELPAPAAGKLTKILKQKGATANVGEVIGEMEEGAATTAKTPAQPQTQPEKPRVMPAAQRVLDEKDLRPEEVQPSGPGGRLLKEDVQRHVEREAPSEPVAVVPGREEEIVPMSLLRRRIAERLVEAQRNAALLTTFNEIDMFAVMALRHEHQEAFTKKYGIKFGIMSFFVKAAIDALKLVPQVNAEVRGTDIVYKNYYDIGVAVGSGRGLVVPVLRNAERLSFAEIEQAIADFAKRAQENKLKPEELTGGTFTISNGGVYGSLLSTPIINPPQSGILGLHAIQERPVAREGQVMIRPIMYVALTYDHRIVDGREAITFLKRVKEVIEEPARMLAEI
jgi:2-oxoglutarate dehydrogenase E2 component (dihydrolipoamide succinyltransferase)